MSIMRKYGLLGTEIQKHMKRVGWKQKDLANQANIGQSTISRIMRDEHRATPDTLDAIGKALEVDPTHLMRLAGIPLPKEKAKRNPEIEQLAQKLDELQPSLQSLVLTAIKSQLDAILFVHKNQKKETGNKVTSRTMTDEEVIGSMKYQASRDVLEVLRIYDPDFFEGFAVHLEEHLYGEGNRDIMYAEETPPA